MGTENLEKVVRSVLLNLTGMTPDRLPKPTFSRYMYLEARRLAQLHVAEEHGVKHCTVMVLQSLGTITVHVTLANKIGLSL